MCRGTKQRQRYGDNGITIIFFTVVKNIDEQWNISLFPCKALKKPYPFKTCVCTTQSGIEHCTDSTSRTFPINSYLRSIQVYIFYVTLYGRFYFQAISPERSSPCLRAATYDSWDKHLPRTSRLNYRPLTWCPVLHRAKQITANRLHLFH